MLLTAPTLYRREPSRRGAARPRGSSFRRRSQVLSLRLGLGLRPRLRSPATGHSESSAAGRAVVAECCRLGGCHEIFGTHTRAYSHSHTHLHLQSRLPVPRSCRGQRTCTNMDCTASLFIPQQVQDRGLADQEPCARGAGATRRPARRGCLLLCCAASSFSPPARPHPS